jgi:hypothetical protein
MNILEFLDELNYFLNPWYNPEDITVFVHSFSIFLINFISYAYILLKFYKVLCYSKMTFEWLPMINPYIWPFSFFHILTAPYFAFWSRILPAIKLDNSSVEISGIIALEALNSFTYFCVNLTTRLIIILEETEQNSFLQ